MPLNSGLRLDFCLAARSLRRGPALVLAGVLTLALGIGVTAALASAVYAGAWRPLPYPHARRLVALTAKSTSGTGVSPADLADWSARSHSLAAVTLFRFHSSIATGTPPARRMFAMMSTPALFQVLGLRPRLGRTMEAADLRPGAEAVAWLSDAAWRKYFFARPAVLGQKLMLDGTETTVVGVLPAGFLALAGRETDLLVPLALSSAELADRQDRQFYAVARLHTGVPLAAARTDVNAAVAETAALYAADRGLHVSLVSLRHNLTGDLGHEPALLLVAAGLILLLACSNVSGLHLARVLARRHELAVRLALGAGRARLVRQLLAEGLLLGAAGGVVGAGLAGILLRSLPLWHPPYWLSIASVSRLATVLLVVAASVASGFLCSLTPAWLAVSSGASEMLQSGNGVAGAGPRSSHRLRAQLVVCELALALMLAVAAGVLIRTVDRITSVPLGFDASQVLTADFGLPAGASQVASNAFYHPLLAAVQALPAARAAALTADLPFDSAINFIAVHGSVRAPVQAGLVSPDYFSTFSVPILRGRGFTDRDRAGVQQVALVSSSLAAAWWPGRDAIGQQFRLTFKPNTRPWTVIGIVGDVHQMSYTSAIKPTAYFPLAQMPWPRLSLAVRVAGPPSAMIPVLRAVASAVDASVPLVDPAVMSDTLASSFRARSFVMRLLAMAAGLALLLAAVGVYGAVGAWADERTREIGVRMALGADRCEVVGLVLGRAFRWAILGGIGGVMAAWAATQSLRSLLWGVRPGDPLSFFAASALLLATALAAAALPAWRASRCDPVRALRQL